MRKLFFDEIFGAFYDYAECGSEALSWPATTPLVGDTVRTVEDKFPVHREAIVAELRTLGLGVTSAIDGNKEWATVMALDICGMCGGDGVVDSGAPDHYGGFYTVRCPVCGGTGYFPENSENEKLGLDKAK